MRSIKARFNKVQKKNPYLSTIICFNIAIRNQGFKKKKLIENFNKLVDKNDYCKKDKKEIIKFILRITKVSEEW